MPLLKCKYSEHVTVNVKVRNQRNLSYEIINFPDPNWCIRMQMIGTTSNDIKELPKDRLKRCRKRALASTAISIRASDVHRGLTGTIAVLAALDLSITRSLHLACFDHVIIRAAKAEHGAAPVPLG